MGQVYGYANCSECSLTSTKIRFTNPYTRFYTEVSVQNGQLMGYVAPGSYRLTLWCVPHGKWVGVSPSMVYLTYSPQMINVVSSCSS